MKESASTPTIESRILSDKEILGLTSKVTAPDYEPHGVDLAELRDKLARVEGDE